MNIEFIDYALYAAAAISLAAALWPRRKQVPPNYEQQKDCITVQKVAENRREMQQREEVQEDDFGIAKLMLEDSTINERIGAINYIQKIQDAYNAVVWMNNRQETMSWDELASQQTTVKPQSQND